MTIYTAKEIIQTKNALDLFRNFVITGDSGGAAMTFPVERAAKTLLQLITGKHPDYVVVPREPTDEISKVIFGKIINQCSPEEIYKTAIQAAMGGKRDE